MNVSRHMRYALTTTAVVLALAVVSPALASDSKLVDILHNQNKEVTTNNLNQAMLDLMNNKPSPVKATVPQECDPKIPGLVDDPKTEENECDLGRIAPAAGDDGDDEPAAEETPDQPDEVNDPEPEQPREEPEEPKEDAPEDDYTPPYDYTPEYDNIDQPS